MGILPFVLEWLVKTDVRLFQFVNHQLSHPVGDLLMPLVTLLGDQYVALVISGVTSYVGRHRARQTGVAMLAASGTSLVLATVIKRLIGRPRPMVRLMGVHLMGAIPPFESFPSAHAAIAFALAGVLALRYRRWGWVALLLAALVGCSRVYMGLHYPSDVVAGAMVGVAVAVIAVAWVERWRLVVLPAKAKT